MLFSLDMVIMEWYFDTDVHEIEACRDTKIPQEGQLHGTSPASALYEWQVSCV